LISACIAKRFKLLIVTNGQKAIIFDHNQIGSKPGHGYDSEFFGRYFYSNLSQK
jgi:hypothetical protein